MKKNLLMAIVMATTNLFSQTGNVGIGTSTPYSSAILDLTATDKALLLPRVANAAAVATPTNGMMVYDISQKCVIGYENNTWSACLSNTGGGGPQPPTPTPIGGNCDSNWFVNPVSLGTSLARGTDNNYEDFVNSSAILLDNAGKKFYTNSSNIFFDLDIENVLIREGINMSSGSIYNSIRFPRAMRATSSDSKGIWYEVKVFGQLYPTKTWKQFSIVTRYYGTGYLARWVLLLSTDGELKSVLYNDENTTNTANAYPGITGREGVGKATNPIAINAADYYRTTDIKAYSNVNTPTATNWDWFEPIFNTITTQKAILAYNKADNFYYTWGGADYNINGQGIAPNLLRSVTTVTESMTPLPATVLNNLLNTLNTTIKKPSDEHSTFFGNTILTFITSDNRIIRFNQNGNYISLSLPNGVNPISISGEKYTMNSCHILGSDGKIYKTSTIPTGVGQTGTIMGYADPIWATTNYPNVKQMVNYNFIDQDGKNGVLGSPLLYPVPFMPKPISRLLAVSGNNNFLFSDKDNNFGEVLYYPSNVAGGFNYYASHTMGVNGLYGKAGNLGSDSSFKNYIYNGSSFTRIPKDTKSIQQYPEKCLTYESTLKSN